MNQQEAISAVKLEYQNGSVLITSGFSYQSFSPLFRISAIRKSARKFQKVLELNIQLVYCSQVYRCWCYVSSTYISEPEVSCCRTETFTYYLPFPWVYYLYHSPCLSSGVVIFPSSKLTSSRFPRVLRSPDHNMFQICTHIVSMTICYFKTPSGL